MGVGEARRGERGNASAVWEAGRAGHDLEKKPEPWREPGSSRPLSAATAGTGTVSLRASQGCGLQ